MKILLVNDDGIQAKGLWTLADVLLQVGHEVVVVAPTKQQSGTSHAVTLHGALLYERVEASCPAYQLSGTPCDCVKFGLLMLSSGVQCVISGINDTMNVGTDVLYSGTVNAALEGAIEGVPSIAVSVNAAGEDYDYPARFVVDNLERLIALCGEDVAVSVNIPSSLREELQGVRVASCGVRKFEDYYELREDGYYIGGTPIPSRNAEHSDLVLSAQGYICVTPIRFELSDRVLLNRWRKKVESLCW